MTLDDYDRTLKFCNAIRRKKGLPPLEKMPRGTPRVSTTCPIARAISSTELGAVGVASVRTGLTRFAKRLPGFARRFVYAVDDPENRMVDLVDPLTLVTDFPRESFGDPAPTQDPATVAMLRATERR